MKKPAQFWKKIDKDVVRCELCPHMCVIREGKAGICRIRKNENGTLYSIGYGETTSLSMDPIEKKPLFHFKPGSYILSVAPNGCNLRCQWCQNWQISQSEVPTRYISPEQLVDVALRKNSSGIAFTYTEPIIWYEYILDVAHIARPKGLSIVLVTNGYINSEPLQTLLPNIDAMNVDLKSTTEEIYVRYIGGHLQPVLDTIRASAGKCLLEVTNLIVPTLNDSQKDIQTVVDFIAEIDPKIPLHFSRYYPSFHLDIPTTPPETLHRAYSFAREKLKYVYIGNLPGSDTEDTFCPECGNTLVRRKGFMPQIVGIDDSHCSNCKTDVDIVF